MKIITTSSFCQRTSLSSYFWPGLILGVCCATAPVSRASLSAFDGNVILNANGSGNVFYAVDSYNNPSYNGNLGGLTIQAGQSLLLGGQIQTYPGYGVSGAASSAFIGYSISDTAIAGTLDLPFAYHPGGGPNDLWEQSSTGGEVNLDQGLSAGTYTLVVYFGAVANDGSGTVYDNNGGANYSATFTVAPVPEPVALALPIFGGLALAAGAARRFLSRRADPAA